MSSRRSRIIAAFRSKFEQTYGSASGHIFYRLRVSKHPQKWRYGSVFQTSSGSGLTFVGVEACVSWQWDDIEAFPWANHLIHRQSILPLGAVEIAPCEGIDQLWRVRCLMFTGQGRYSLETVDTFVARKASIFADSDPSISHIRAAMEDAIVSRVNTRIRHDRPLSAQPLAHWIPDEVEKFYRSPHRT